MATYKLIANAMPVAASDTSLTSAFAVPGEFTHFMIQFPSAMAATTTCGIQVLGSDSASGTFYTVGYSNNPATATSGFRAWDCGTDSPGNIIICEALQFVPGFAKLKFTNTLTANTGINIWGRKFD
jgi:hypothetical protein